MPKVVDPQEFRKLLDWAVDQMYPVLAADGIPPQKRGAMVVAIGSLLGQASLENQMAGMILQAVDSMFEAIVLSETVNRTHLVEQNVHAIAAMQADGIRLVYQMGIARGKNPTAQEEFEQLILSAFKPYLVA
jgi:hypothetical protein